MTDLRLKAVCEDLYDACLKYAPGHIFFQEDLLGLSQVPQDDVNLLAKCINALTAEHLFKPLSKEGRACWKLSSREDAKKYKELTPDEALVYSYIDEGGREGSWVKTIRSKSNLHQTPLNKCLRSLEQKNLIKQLQSQRHPSRRIYMLSSLQPPEELSGGPFYSDGNLDADFIHWAMISLRDKIDESSWQRVSKRKRVTVAESDPPHRHSSRKSHNPSKESYSERITLLPMPPGYIGYPTLGDLTQYFNNTGLSHVKLKEDEVSQLLDLLYWDGRIEKVLGGTAFKTVHPEATAKAASMGNAFTNAPCGRCPVSDLCSEEGPVNVDTCKYFGPWLGEEGL